MYSYQNLHIIVYFSSSQPFVKWIHVINTEPTCYGAGHPCIELYTKSGRVHIQASLCDGLPVVDHLNLSYLLSSALCTKTT